MLEKAHERLVLLLGRRADNADELLAEKAQLAKLEALGEQVVALLEGHQADCELVRKQCADSRALLEAVGYTRWFQLLAARVSIL